MNQHENPLVWPILQLLEKQNNNWKVHSLMAALLKEGLILNLDTSAEKELFKRNFLIMNALYQLQELLLPERCLNVDAMDIHLSEYTENTSEALSIDSPLRQYYLNWANYETDEEAIKTLLDDFWTKYHSYIGSVSASLTVKQALDTFKLTEDASRDEVKKRWRELALKWHPDREGGNKEQFRRYCEAWSVLKE